MVGGRNALFAWRDGGIFSQILYHVVTVGGRIFLISPPPLFSLARVNFDKITRFPKSTANISPFRAADYYWSAMYWRRTAPSPANQCGRILASILLIALS